MVIPEMGNDIAVKMNELELQVSAWKGIKGIICEKMLVTQRYVQCSTNYGKFYVMK